MKIYWIVPIFLLIIACKKEEVIESPRTIVEDSFVSIPILPTSINRSFELKNGRLWNFRLTATEDPQDQKLPLIIALHYAGTETAFQTYSDCLAKPGFIDLPCIIFAPSSNGLGWEDPENEYNIRDFIRLAKLHWPNDTSRIVITGYSNGGIGTWRFATTFAEEICASIPMGGYYDKATRFSIPLYIYPRCCR